MQSARLRGTMPPPRRTVAPRSPEQAALGEAIRSFRTEAGLTQEQLAERAGTDFKQIGGLERGTGNPTYATLVRLASALETRVGAITGLADSILDRG